MVPLRHPVLSSRRIGGEVRNMTTRTLDDATVVEIERHAVEIARGAGEILAGHFGRRIEVEFKDDKQRDPVTAADKQTQAYLASEITRRFPGHGILGEEATEEEKQSEEPARDTLWVLDPLDGTTNFLNGLPVFASSIGVIHRGRPVAAALYIPWPADGGGFVLHCRKGGGARISPLTGGGRRIPVSPSRCWKRNDPSPTGSSACPATSAPPTVSPVGWLAKEGEPRTTGSIAFELAMTARGVMQYGVFGAPRMWDMAGGALAVQEAGGTVMTRFRGERQWHPIDSFVPSWEEKTPTMKELRAWVAPLGGWQPEPGAAHRQQRPPPLQPPRQAPPGSPRAAGQETASEVIAIQDSLVWNDGLEIRP